MSTVNIIRVVAVVALVAIMVWFFAGSSITDLFSGGGSGSADNDGTVSSVTVSRNRVVCESVTGQNCLVIDGELFYQEIEDFDFQTGCEYQIRIQKREVSVPPRFQRTVRAIAIGCWRLRRVTA